MQFLEVCRDATSEADGLQDALHWLEVTVFYKLVCAGGCAVALRRGCWGYWCEAVQ